MCCLIHYPNTNNSSLQKTLHLLLKNVFHFSLLHQVHSQAGGHHGIAQSGLPHAGHPLKVSSVPFRQNYSGYHCGAWSITASGTIQYIYALQIHHNIGGKPSCIHVKLSNFMLFSFVEAAVSMSVLLKHTNINLFCQSFGAYYQLEEYDIPD